MDSSPACLFFLPWLEGVTVRDTIKQTETTVWNITRLSNYKT